MSDFLAKYYSASELIEYDKELIKTTQEQKAQLESEKTELENSKTQLNTAKEEFYNINPDVYNCLSDSDYAQIRNYIDNPMTATTFSEDKNGKANREIVTAELIYYWMIALNIPFECQKWHLNRLLTLIRVCNIKNQPPKKMGKQATLNQYAKLNAARKAQMNTKG